jgi:hypothetical protein
MFFLDDKAHARFLALLDSPRTTCRGPRPVHPQAAMGGVSEGLLVTPPAAWAAATTPSIGHFAGG